MKGGPVMTDADRDAPRGATWECETRAALALSLVPGVGPRLARRLLDEFGTAVAIGQQPRRRLLQVPGVGEELAAALVAARSDGRGATGMGTLPSDADRGVGRPFPAVPLAAARDRRSAGGIVRARAVSAAGCVGRCHGGHAPRIGLRPSPSHVRWPQVCAARGSRSSVAWRAGSTPRPIEPRWMWADGRSRCWPAASPRCIRPSTMAWRGRLRRPGRC